MKEKLSEQEFKPSDSLWDRLEQELEGDSFEPAVREKLDGLSIQPSSGTWEKIEAKLPLENKRKLIYLWLPALVLSALGLGFWLNTALNNQEIVQANQPTIVSESQVSIPSTSSNDIANQPASSDFQIQPEQANDASTLASNANQSKPEPSLSQVEVATTNQNASAQATREYAVSGSLNTPISNKVSRRNRSDYASAAPDKTNSTKKKRNSGGRSSANSELNSAIAIARGVLLAANNSSSQTGPTPTANPSQLNAEPNAEKPAANNEATASKPKIAGRILSEEKEPIRLEDQQIRFDKDSLVHQSDAKSEDYESEADKPGRFAIVAMAGVNYTSMSLAMPSSSAYDLSKAFDLRKSLEKASFDWSGGFLLSYQVSPKFSIASGVQILNIRQTLNYNLEGTNANPNHVQSSNLYIHPTDSIVEGQVKVKDNKYSFTEIPVWINYSFNESGRWSFEVMAGYSLGLLSSVNMYMPDPSCIGLLNANDKDAFPKFRSVHFVNLAPLVSWKLNNTVQLGVMPQVKFGLNSMVDNSNWIGQKPFAGGIQLFLRKRL